MAVIYADMPYGDFVVATANLSAEQVMERLAKDRDEVDDEYREAAMITQRATYDEKEAEHMKRIERLMAYFELTMAKLPTSNTASQS